MFEWIESPSQSLKRWVFQVQRIPDYSDRGRIDRMSTKFRECFPRSHFSVQAGGLDLAGWRKYSIIADLAHADILERSPRWLAGAEDYFWAWNEMLVSLKAAASKLKIDFNYFKENRERLHCVLRHYQMARSEGSSSREKAFYYLELQVTEPTSSQPASGAALAESRPAQDSVQPGVQMKIDVLLSPETTVFLENSVDLIQLWLGVA